MRIRNDRHLPVGLIAVAGSVQVFGNLILKLFDETLRAVNQIIRKLKTEIARKRLLFLKVNGADYGKL